MLVLLLLLLVVGGVQGSGDVTGTMMNCTIKAVIAMDRSGSLSSTSVPPSSLLTESRASQFRARIVQGVQREFASHAGLCLALVHFATEAHVVVNYTDNPQFVLDALLDTQFALAHPEYYTNWQAALVTALGLEPAIVYLLTDGPPSTRMGCPPEAEPCDDAAANLAAAETASFALQEGGTRVVAIGFGPQVTNEALAAISGPCPLDRGCRLGDEYMHVNATDTNAKIEFAKALKQLEELASTTTTTTTVPIEPQAAAAGETTTEYPAATPPTEAATETTTEPPPAPTTVPEPVITTTTAAPETTPVPEPTTTTVAPTTTPAPEPTTTTTTPAPEPTTTVAPETTPTTTAAPDTTAVPETTTTTPAPTTTAAPETTTTTTTAPPTTTAAPAPAVSTADVVQVAAAKPPHVGGGGYHRPGPGQQNRRNREKQQPQLPARQYLHEHAVVRTNERDVDTDNWVAIVILSVVLAVFIFIILIYVCCYANKAPYGAMAVSPAAASDEFGLLNTGLHQVRRTVQQGKFSVATAQKTK